MKLKVISLKGVKFEGEAKAFNVKTALGEITVLDNHRPLITLLGKGKSVIIKPDGSREEMEIFGGFLEKTSANELDVLIDN